MPILLIIAIFLGGGASVAAEKTVPGDALYPVKVSINENVRGWFTVSDEAKAAWEVRLAERRLDEAEKLAAEVKLNAEVRAELADNFEKHANRVEERIEKFASKDSKAAADINANFETSLKVHARILENIGAAKDEAVEPEIRALLIKVRAETDDAAKNKEDAEKTVKAEVRADVQASAEGRMKAAENKIAEVRKFIDRVKAEIGAEATVQAEARLKLAEDTLAQGKAKLEAKAYGEAFVLFGKAHAIAQEAKLLIEAKMRFEEKAVPPRFIGPPIKITPNVDQNSTESKSRIRIDIGL